MPDLNAMNIVYRYITRMFLQYFFGTLVVICALYLVVQATSTLMENKPSVGALIAYYGYSLPAVMYQMIPVAGVSGTIFTLSAMNKSNELVALFASGFSLTRIAFPILVAISLISAGAFIFSDQVMPSLNQKKNYVQFVEIEKKPGAYSTVKTDRIWFKSKNVILNLKTLDAEKGVAQGVTFYYFDQAWNLVQLITAEKLLIGSDKWNLENGIVTLFASESSFPLTQNFKSKELPIPDGFDVHAAPNSSDVMSSGDLKKFIERNKAAGLDTLRYEVDYQAKFGFAFAAIVMSFIGVPFSVGFNRSGGRALNLAICMGLVFVYWSSYSSGLTLGYHGTIPPLFAAWIPNIIMITLTSFFMLRLKK